MLTRKPFGVVGLLLIILVFLAFKLPEKNEDWGFFGHRMINRYAVFTLPQEMLPLYKSNVDYLEEHAVDPDKRRYATKFEAIRHYIDIDHWGTYPFDNVPRDFGIAVTKFSSWKLVDERGDSTLIQKTFRADSIDLIVNGSEVLSSSLSKFNWFFNKNILPKYYDEEIVLSSSALDIFFNVNVFSNSYKSLVIDDEFSEYGVLPYHLVKMQKDLTNAFVNEDWQKVIRLSADFGHYIGDAHVPLHTTVNYNGQLTDQIGIHAFWESRIPELFAVDSYDLFAGKAEYINDKQSYYWDIVLTSHSLLSDVLDVEKELSKSFPPDQQYCYDDRLGRTVRIQCEEYAKAYSRAMQGMVEDRFRSSIKAIGDAWYTAWVDAGQPSLDFGQLKIKKEKIKVDKSIKTRSHEN